MKAAWAAAASLIVAGCGDGAGGGSDADASADTAGDTAADTRDDTHVDPDVTTDVEVDPGPECAGLLVEHAGTASTIDPPAGSVPDPGEPFTIAATGVRVTRISDVGDPDAQGSFYTNGYSRWSAASITGEYVTAFSSTGGASIYRLSDRTIVATLPVGEPNELHWDSSGEAGTQTTIYYRHGPVLRRTDVLAGTDEVVHDFRDEYPAANHAMNGVEGAPSMDMRFWAFQICDGMTGGGQCTGLMDVVVYDREADAIHARLSDVESSIPVPNYVDISPSGSRIVVGTCKESGSTPEPWNGPWAWSLDFSSRVRVSTNCSHSGWAWGYGGEELQVSFDPCGAANEEITFSCDHLTAVDVNDPSGWENRFPILHNEDIGWGTGSHFGRVYLSHVTGWLFISTYGGDTWASDQLFFVELVPIEDSPRIFRVAPTLNEYTDYWSEAFASLDFHGLNVYWGANWGGAGNLELYRAELCAGWWEVLAE
jgi:hypothetical protein